MGLMSRFLFGAPATQRHVTAPEQVAGRVGETAGTRVRHEPLFAKLSSYDERSARLAGIGLMLLSIFMFSFGDALGKFMVATYSVGQLHVAARLCGATGALPIILQAARRVQASERHVAAAASRPAFDAGSRGVLSRHRLFAARRRHHLLSGLADFCHRALSASCSVSTSAGGAGPRS